MPGVLIGLMVAFALIALGSIVNARRTNPASDVQPAHQAVPGAGEDDVRADDFEEDDAVGIDDRFIYETIARYDDRVQAKIDAADGAIISVLAANGAVVIFAIDKINELEQVDAHIATYFLVASCATCVVGYLVGLFPPLRAEEFSPTAFLKRATFEPIRAVEEATEGLVDAYRDNKRVLVAKRIVILVAIGFLVGAVIATTQGRVFGT